MSHLLTARQWQDWLEFASVEPIGDERDDWRAAFVGASLASCWAEGIEVENFKIDWLKERQQLPLEERLKCIVAAHNARIDGGGNHR